MKMVEVEVGGKGRALVELDGRNPGIAERICQSLPLIARAKLWGEEVYFELSIKNADEDPSPTSQEGDVSWWSPGCALCIYFGSTQPYSPVNHIGRVKEGLDRFYRVEAGDTLVLRRA